MNIHFILVEPAVPGNIGSSARALKTMGFHNLILVKPCNIRDPDTLKFAHGSHDILNSSKIFTSLEEAIVDVDMIIGTTAKIRNSKVEYFSCSKLPELIRVKGDTISTVGIVFGREESGLTNEELNLCDVVTQIPMAENYPSINLSQAVMIYAYILSEFSFTVQSPFSPGSHRNGLKELRKKAELLLNKLDIEKNPALYNRIIERMMLLGEDDIHLMHSVLNRILERDI